MMISAGAALAIGVVFLSLFLKPQQKEIAVLLVTAGVLCLFFIVLTQSGEAIFIIRELSQKSAFSEEIETIIKALGIGAVAEVTADICKTAGESTLAGQVELIGKTEILILSLPLAAKLLTILQEFIT